MSPETVVTYQLADGTITSRRAKYIDFNDPEIVTWHVKFRTSS